MAEQKAKGVVFTPDTNILLNLIFDEYAERDAIEQYNEASAMPEGLDKTFAMHKVTQYLYDRPFYMLLKELIKSGKVTMDVSPIVYSEIINSKKLDDDIRGTIQVSMLNMARDGDNARTILTPNIINQAFQYYISERFGGPEKLQKSVGSKNLIAYIYALKEKFKKDLIDDAVAKKDDYIYKTRKQLVKIIKHDLIKTKLEALGGTVRFMTLAEKVDGKETAFRECIYALADNYRLNQGEVEKRQSVPQGELNDSLIMGIGSRCNISVVTNDRKGLIASKKHIHKVNDKFRSKYGVLITGEPVKLEEFIVKNFPEEVLSFSTRYKPIPRLDIIDKEGDRLGSLEHTVKVIKDSKKSSQAQATIEKQYKDVRLGRELKLIGLDEFFGSFQDTREYDRFVDSVKIARDREKDTFKDSISTLQEEVKASLKTLRHMIFGVQESKGKTEVDKTYSLPAIANQAQSTYRLLLIYATHIYNDLMGSKAHGKFNDYKKIIESLGIKVLEPSKAEEKKGKQLTIVIDGVKFTAAYNNSATGQPSPLKVGLTKGMTDDMVLLGLSNEETRPVMLKRNENFFGTRFQSIGNQYKKLPSYYSYHSFSEVTSLKPSESEETTRYKDNIGRLAKFVELEM